jgi:hypothetical protein
MTAEAQHAHVHLPAAAHDRHVGGDVALDERPAFVDDRALAIDRKVLREMKCAWRDLHVKVQLRASQASGFELQASLQSFEPRFLEACSRQLEAPS